MAVLLFEIFEIFEIGDTDTYRRGRRDSSRLA